MKHLKFSTKLILLSIWLLAAALRLYSLNWDQGYHLHPDERAIVMKVMELNYQSGFSSFFSTESLWNPHFFAYGSLPFYLIKIISDAFSVFDKFFTGYDLITITGRYMSAMFDLMTLILVFLLGKRLWGTMVGFLSAFFYAISVLPIQLSHFYAVDTLLTCFIIAVLYHLVRFYEQPSVKRSLLIGLFFGLALATKISAVILIVPIGAALVIDFNWFPHLPSFLRHLFKYALLIIISAAITFIICEPYAVIAFQEFWLHTTQQSIMTRNAFIFPYTLQYVGKIPYLFELKNIFFWGLGPILATLAILGALYVTFFEFSKNINTEKRKVIIIITFFWIYFFVVGRFAVGFMRYMLPLYPLLALFAGLLSKRLITETLNLVPQKLANRRHYIYKSLLLIYCGLLLLAWPLSFSRIYAQPNTRITASKWINQNIPAGKTIAVEHWDDGLPLVGAQNYQIITLPLYEPDTDQKWKKINHDLKQTDYIIIASNRLYTPLQRLTDCARLPVERCYPVTAEYYRKLFTNELGFHKVADFTNYPKVPFFDIPINDQSADESFTVYDHPGIMIFQKNK